jgi:hypothetical protein
MVVDGYRLPLFHSLPDCSEVRAIYLYQASLNVSKEGAYSRLTPDMPKDPGRSEPAQRTLSAAETTYNQYCEYQIIDGEVIPFKPVLSDSTCTSLTVPFSTTRA